MKRIFAAHHVLCPDGTVIDLGYVEIADRHVNKVGWLCGEQPFTEWIGGTIDISLSADGLMTAYKDGLPLGMD